MNYISSEEFLNQSEKVKRVLLEWWNPQVGDLYCNIYNNQNNNVLVINNCQLIIKNFEIDIKKFGAPLLQMHQLIQFIEDNTKCKINIENYNTNDILLRFIKYGKEVKSCMYCDCNLLKSLWKASIKIAEESV